MPEEPRPDPQQTVIKGRGATQSNTPTRFNLPSRQIDGDWRDVAELVDGKPPSVRTTITEEHPRKILTFNRSPDIPFDRSINAYRGCEHGCIYCFARPSHAYHDLSPGLDFETRLFAKPAAAALLREELAKPNYTVQPIAVGTNTDPYQPIEGRYHITRSILEVMVETRHPIGITTKSNRVCRDIDLLTHLAAQQLTAVAVSITSLRPEIARTLEPRAPHPQKRLEAVRMLCEAGIPTSVNIAPVVPAITDDELEAIASAAALAGAGNIAAIPVRLPYEVAPLFRDWLDAHFPDRKGKVMAIIRSLRGGRDNDPRFHHRMKGQGAWADLLQKRVEIARRRHGFKRNIFGLRTDLFRAPVVKGTQFDLFGP